MSDNTDRTDKTVVTIPAAPKEPKENKVAAKPVKGKKEQPVKKDKVLAKEKSEARSSKEHKPSGSIPPTDGTSVPPKVVIGSFTKNAMDWLPEVQKGSSADKYLTTVLHVTPRYPRDGILNNTNQHPCQAAERGLATARGLAYLYAAGIRKVTSVYGSPRDENIANFCNAKVPQADKLELVRYSPTVTSKDFSRQPTTITYGDAVRNSQTLFLVDVYKTDIGPAAPFCPEVIGRMLEPMQHYVGGNKILWIGRCYYADSGLIAEEGGWYRDGDEIIFRSSELEPPEYGHQPCDWIWKQSSCNIMIHGVSHVLSWSLMKVIGTFQVVAFHVTLGRLEEAKSGGLYQYIETFVKVRCYQEQTSWLAGWLQHIPLVSNLSRRWHPCLTEKRIYKPMYLYARGSIMAKRYTQTNFDRVTTALTNAHLEKSTALFLKLFPQFAVASRDYSSIAWALLTDDIEQRKVCLQMAHAVDGNNMAEVNHLQSEIGVAPSPVSTPLPLKILAGLGVVASCYALWKGFRYIRPVRVPISAVNGDYIVRFPFNYLLFREPRIHSDNLFVSILSGWASQVVVTPIVEETVKRVLSKAHLGWLLPVYEFYTYAKVLDAQGANLSQILLLRMPALAMHLAANRMPLGRAIATHMFWNGFGSVYYIVFLSLFSKYHGCFFDQSTLVKGRLKLVVCMILGLLGLVLWRSKGLFPRVSEYDKWKKVFYYDEWESRGIYEDPRSFSCPVTDWAVPESTSPLPVNEEVLRGASRDENFIAVKGNLTPPEKEKATQHFYHILPTSAPGFVPAANHQNLKVAIEQRLLKPPPLAPMLQARHWKRMDAKWGKDLFDLVDCPPITDEWEDLVDDWLVHFTDTRKKNRYKLAVAQLKKEALTFQVPKETSLFVKHDEMLMQQRDGVYTLKPRVIANVDPLFQARVGPYVYVAQKRLGAIWSVDSPSVVMVDFRGNIPPTTFHFMMGGGVSDLDLSRWMRKVLRFEYVRTDEVGFCILVCGDDVVLVFSYMGELYFIELDASMFDQSISFGPIRRAIALMVRLGVWERVLQALYYAHGINYVVKNPNQKDSHLENYVLDLFKRFMQATGIATTYLLNCIVMLTSVYYVVREVQEYQWTQFLADPAKVLAAEFLKLGFAMKLKVHRDYRRVTFLKGVWYACPEPCWGPLPSRILKMGKSLHDPRSLYRMTDQYSAGLNFLRDVASSYAVFLQVPIVRAYVKRFSGTVIRPHSSARLNVYTSKGSGSLSRIVLDDEAIQAICARYDIIVQDIHRVEMMIMNADALTFLHDPVFQSLAAVDYA